MKPQEIINKIGEKWKKVTAKIGRKGATVICTAVLILSAVVLNVVLFTNRDGNDSDNVQVNFDSDNAEAVNGSTSDNEDYFASVSLSRNQARDDAVDVLLEVTDDTDSTEEAKASAMAEMERIAVDIERESNIEAMIKAKGFEECIAVISGDSANVIVKSDTLTPGETAQISEIVYSAAGITPSNLKIIEKS